jgi:hypothetical protein
MLGGESFDSMVELIFLEFVVFYDRFLKFLLNIFNLELVRVAISFIQLPEMRLERLLILLNALHCLLEVWIACLDRYSLTSKSVR